MALEEFDAMLWLGDNVYLREGMLGACPVLFIGTPTRSLPEMQALLSKGSHYASGTTMILDQTIAMVLGSIRIGRGRHLRRSGPTQIRHPSSYRIEHHPFLVR